MASLLLLGFILVGVVSVLLIVLRHSLKPLQPDHPVAALPVVTEEQKEVIATVPDMPTPEQNLPTYRLEINTSDLRWNAAFYPVFGYEPQEHANTLDWWITHIHPDDALLVNDELSKLLDTTVQGWDVEYRFRRGNQSFVRVKDHVVVERDNTGQAVAVLGVMTPQPHATTTSV